MSGTSDIVSLYREFTDALTEVLAESAIGPARRGRLGRPARLLRVSASLASLFGPGRCGYHSDRRAPDNVAAGFGRHGRCRSH